MNAGETREFVEVDEEDGISLLDLLIPIAENWKLMVIGLSVATALAGGPTHGADAGSVFVLRTNGSVISAPQQYNGWFGSNGLNLLALPGNTVFVPEELNKTTFVQVAKEWTQTLAQFALVAAAVKTLGN